MPPIPWPSSQVAMLKAAIALAAVLLLATRLRREVDQQPPSKLQDLGLAGLGLIAFLAWFNFGAYGFGSSVHHYEFFHYYLGSSTSSELGYAGLYDCVGAAEIEQGRRKEVYGQWRRDLRSNEIRKGDSFAAGFADCRRRFTSADRWTQFKHDVEYFRTHLGPEAWRQVVVDHGYNPSPVWTVVGKALASTGPATPSTDRFTLVDRPAAAPRDRDNCVVDVWLASSVDRTHLVGDEPPLTVILHRWGVSQARLAAACGSVAVSREARSNDPLGRSARVVGPHSDLSGNHRYRPFSQDPDRFLPGETPVRDRSARTVHRRWTHRPGSLASALVDGART